MFRYSHLLTVLFLFTSELFAATSRPNAGQRAQPTPGYGYQGYNLTKHGDQNSTVYETASTPANATVLEPDVFLNASVHVGEISLQVDDIRAKVNLDAKVLQLLSFSAGVDASIDSVRLLIQNISAKVILEARLENLVLMINDVLHSLDLNPIIATLGNDLNHLVNSTANTLEGKNRPQGQPAPKGATQSASATNSIQARSLHIEQNILYSVNDYSGSNHMNRVLAKNGEIVDEFLDNHGTVYDRKISGHYATDMAFTGHDKDVMHDGQVAREREYKYAPFPGLEVVSAIYINEQQSVIGAQVLSEASGGGSSTIENETR